MSVDTALLMMFSYNTIEKELRKLMNRDKFLRFQYSLVIVRKITTLYINTVNKHNMLV